MAANEAKEEGRQAFKEKRWEDAITAFTKTLEEDPQCMTAYAVRSSAYQKLGNLDAALKDADTTIEMDPSYVRGYIRKACVLRAMKMYSEEVDSYLKGLEHCPEDESLQKGLQMARRLKTATSKASQAARTTQATLDAALSRSHKANQAKDLKGFVAQTKWNLELQMVSLQAQLQIIAEMEHLNESDKIDLLYQLLTTKEVTGNILVESLKQASSNLPFKEDIIKALATVTPPSASVILDRVEFETFVKALVASMEGTSINEFAEFVVCQVLFVQGLTTDSSAADAAAAADDSGMSEAADVVAASSAPKSILNDPRMKALFVLFDKDADATVDFKEVAMGLYPLTNSMEDSAKKAAGLLLMMDKDDQRVMSYEQFAKLIMGVAAAMKMTFDELADQLTLALTNGTEISAAVMAEILVEEKAYEAALEKQQKENAQKKTMDALSYSRTQKLFELWDANGDGDIDFQELLAGLRKYQKAAMGSSNLQDLERDALMIMGHDKDSNQTLDTEEFAWAMANYAEAIKTDLHELIDFMVVVSSKDDTTEYETFYSQASVEVASKRPSFKQSLGTILDVEGDDSEEEDDW